MRPCRPSPHLTLPTPLQLDDPDLARAKALHRKVSRKAEAATDTKAAAAAAGPGPGSGPPGRVALPEPVSASSKGTLVLGFSLRDRTNFLSTLMRHGLQAGGDPSSESQTMYIPFIQVRAMFIPFIQVRAMYIPFIQVRAMFMPFIQMRAGGLWAGVWKPPEGGPCKREALSCAALYTVYL